MHVMIVVPTNFTSIVPTILTIEIDLVVWKFRKNGKKLGNCWICKCFLFRHFSVRTKLKKNYQNRQHSEIVLRFWTFIEKCTLRHIVRIKKIGNLTAMTLIPRNYTNRCLNFLFSHRIDMNLNIGWCFILIYTTYLRYVNFILSSMSFIRFLSCSLLFPSCS